MEASVIEEYQSLVFILNDDSSLKGLAFNLCGGNLLQFPLESVLNLVLHQGVTI